MSHPLEERALELAAKWDVLVYGPEMVDSKFRQGYEGALRDCAKELRQVIGPDPPMPIVPSSPDDPRFNGVIVTANDKLEERARELHVEAERLAECLIAELASVYLQKKSFAHPGDDVSAKITGIILEHDAQVQADARLSEAKWWANNPSPLCDAEKNCCECDLKRERIRALAAAVQPQVSGATRTAKELKSDLPSD